MSIGEWQPPKAVEITQEKLEQYLGFARAITADNLLKGLDPQLIIDDRVLMSKPAAAWKIADRLDSSALVGLVRFFTLAEQQLPGWSAGKDSPVIPLVKILRGRKAFDPTLRRWIKNHTDNRYLPNGAIL